jgi:hypothetical protein
MKMNLIKLHVNLIKVIFKEIKSNKKKKEKIKFIKTIAIQYFKVLQFEIVTLWNIITNKDYRKKRKQLKKFQQLKVDLKRGLQLLRYIDKNLIKLNIDRKARRNFWKEFYNSGKIRKEVLEQLEKELNIVGGNK